MPRLFSGKNLLLFLLVVVFTVVVMRVTGSDRIKVSPLENALRDITAPLQRVAMEVGHRVRGVFSFPVSLVRSSKENQELTEQVARLEGQLREASEYQLENERLKKVLNFQSDIAHQAGLQVAPAAVIGRDPGNWFSTLVINKGSRHGIKSNMTVIAPEGLVGRVTAVSGNTSEVLLISDPRSGVGSIIQETRAPGLVEGMVSGSDLLRMVHIPNSIPVKQGQTILTSGLGSLFPKGIPIGEVVGTGREPSGLFLSADVKPFVDFNRLEEVMVITRVSSRLASAENTKQQLSGAWGLPPSPPALPKHPNVFPH